MHVLKIAINGVRFLFPYLKVLYHIILRCSLACSIELYLKGVLVLQILRAESKQKEAMVLFNAHHVVNQYILINVIECTIMTALKASACVRLGFRTKSCFGELIISISRRRWFDSCGGYAKR